MWIVQIGLKRPYTFVVLALAILLFGTLSAARSPTDVFPKIDIPVVAVVWTYQGMLPDDISGRITYFWERMATVQVTDIEHIESQSVGNYAIIKVFFQPYVNISNAMAEVTAVSQTVLKYLPYGITPPFVLLFDAASVPVIQLALSSKSIPELKVFDLGQNFVRPALATVAGAAVPVPYGGKVREVQSDFNLQAMQQIGVSPDDVVAALTRQNLIIPAGTQKIGKYEWNIWANVSPIDKDRINDMPIKKVNGTVIYMRDIAFTHDGNPPQTNMVRMNGARAVLLYIIKVGSASTLDVIAEARQRLPLIMEGMPKDLDAKFIADQGVIVRASVEGVIREGALAAVLTGLMILLFLGSWRSTLIIALSIPLSALSSIIVISATGGSINTMTLGGLALAVGMLVDEATVTIENINYHLEMGKDIETAILDGAQQIVIPALLSLLAICIVFAPMGLLTGVSHYLFVPMAEAVVFAMIASFILSRTLVVTMANFLLAGQVHQHAEGGHGPARRSRNPLVRFQQGFEHGFERMRAGYRDLLGRALAVPLLFIGGVLGFVIASIVLLGPWLGSNFFPEVDTGQMHLHIRAQTGTRIEETARLCDQVENEIRRLIPPKDLDSFVDNLDLPVSGVDLAYVNSGSIGPQDADVLISLKENHRPTEIYVRELRDVLMRKFPGTTFAFEPPDIISQILNFGLPSPIDVMVVGPYIKPIEHYIVEVYRRMRKVPGLADLRIQQAFNYPQINVNVDRVLAQDVGLTQQDVARSMLETLYGSFQLVPNFWLNYDNGVAYSLSAQMPQYRIDTMADLVNLPVTGVSMAGGDPPTQILGALASFDRVGADAVVSHFNVQPNVDVYATTQGRDLGSVAKDIQRILNETRKDLPPGSYATIRGQVATMQTTYTELFSGLAMSVVLIYLLLVVNFQSWLDPFIIVTALPSAIAGIVWMLFVTGTTLSVPALTGAIMTMGVATANSILVVSFARERLAAGVDSATASLEAGFVRIRPVIMTASAMVIGMFPMALGLGEGGEQNAPLGRAVIGGLLFATVSTLLFVPAVFALLHRNENRKDRADEAGVRRHA